MYGAGGGPGGGLPGAGSVLVVAAGVAREVNLATARQPDDQHGTTAQQRQPPQTEDFAHLGSTQSAATQRPANDKQH